MFCPNCGTKLVEGNGYCTACGTAVVPENQPDQIENQPDQISFPDPTVLPTPEQGRIDPNRLTPEPQSMQSIDIDSIVSNLNEPEPEDNSSMQGFTDEDMAWFTDHQPKPVQTPYSRPAHPQSQPTYSQPTYPQSQPTYPQPMPQQQAPNMPPPANPQYFSQIPVPVDLTPRKSNVLMGFIGALAFSLIGCVIWVIIGSLGFISYLGALAMSFLVITGYKLLGKRFDMAGLLTSLLVVAVAVLASNVFIHAMQLSEGLDEMKKEILEEAASGNYGVSEEDIDEILDMMGLNHTGVIDVFLHFFDYADTIDNINASASGYVSDSIMSTFWRNLVLGYVFSGIAFIVVAIPQLKASR